MEFKYTGNKGGVVYRGVSFARDEYREVPDHLVARLDENPNFRRKPGKKAATSDA